MLNHTPAHWGKIQVFTGNGKGKTTAALGTAMRALGAGKRVAIIYFDKGGTHYSERALLTSLIGYPERSEGSTLGRITFFSTGLDRIDPATGRFRFGVTEEDKAEGNRGLEAASQAIMSGSYDLVVLDEINTSVALGIVPLDPVLELLDRKLPHVEVICTGRDAPSDILDRAELVTEMKLVKHYFYHGVAARKGLDY